MFEIPVGAVRVTDDKRREVAERLRELPSDTYAAIKEWEEGGLFIDASLSDEADYSQIHNAILGCFPAEHMHPGDYEELHERLADLIDLPTCRLDLTDVETHGNFKVRIYECSRCGRESFVVTREQVSRLVDKAYERGQSGGFKPRAFECECDALQLNDWSSQQVARSEWLHIVTARHLRKARRTIRELRGRVERLQDRCYEKDLLLDGYRGQIGRDNPFASVPEHYQGDGFVTCRRAMESCESQEKVVDPSRMAFYWWASAFKYVWRCWSKADPEADMRKAVDCLRKAMGELPGCARQVAHERIEWCGVQREESNG